MHFAPLTLAHKHEWAGLLATSFDRTPEDMLRLLDWLHAGHTVIGWGAWDGDQLAAQYNCCLMDLQAAGDNGAAPVGMSINMAVDPAYRGRGLIKHVSRPVYDAVAAGGGVSGVGFSNKQGVKVDLKSKSYGYQVVGRMQSVGVWLKTQTCDGLCLTDEWPTGSFVACRDVDSTQIQFMKTPDQLAHRFGQHPFRRYQFGVWYEGGVIQGVVVYRRIGMRGAAGASLLAVYGADRIELLRRWSVAIQSEGVRFIHLLTTPHAYLRSGLSQLGCMLVMPYSRSPYYLTVKPFAHTPSTFLDFGAWDCLGGDIL